MRLKGLKVMQFKIFQNLNFFVGFFHMLKNAGKGKLVNAFRVNIYKLKVNAVIKLNKMYFGF